VRAARAAGLSFEADQGEVWGEVERRLEHSRAVSPTRSYSDYVVQRTSELGEMRSAFRPLADQVGFVAVIGDEVAGIEAIGRPEVFAASFERLVDAYAVDALDHQAVRESLGKRAPGAEFSEPEAFLEALRQAPVRSGPSLGLGQDLRLEGERLEGCALAAVELVHLTAYPFTEERERGRGDGDPEEQGDLGSVA
jgi:hypothetical protein